MLKCSRLFLVILTVIPAELTIHVVAASAVHGGWSAWNVGYCSKTCGGSGVRTDWRACNSPPPLLGGDHCHGPASRTMPCYTCPCE